MSRHTTKDNQLVTLTECPHYWVVKDAHIPIEPKENIILKPSGLQQIATHYRTKYGITIYVHTTPINIAALAELIQNTILMLKKSNSKLTQAGLIFINNDDPDDIFGHALPMIWQKDEEREHLFFLDTMQLLGETDGTKIKFNVDIFREKLLPVFKLWAMHGHRQVDYSSCYTDALVILKDGLCQSSFKSTVENKIKSQETDITLFYAPEILLRTTQVVSLIRKSNTKSDALVHKTYSLEDWIKAYSKDIVVKGNPKKFGMFTLFKAEKYARKFAIAEKNDSQLNTAKPE